MVNLLDRNTIGEIVAEDYRAATVFKQYDIDFCCKGNRSLSEVCRQKGLQEEEVMDALRQVTSEAGQGAEDYASWSPDRLASHIEARHHGYVREQIPVLNGFLEKLCKVHGERHPELFEIRELMEGAGHDLSMHMHKEERVLFPYIRELSAARREGVKSMPPPPFGTAANPVAMMKEEHEHEGDRFRRIAEITDNYQAPADGCTTYRVAFQLLRDFEQDLHLHIHLENNILFPAALELEKEMRHAEAH